MIVTASTIAVAERQPPAGEHEPDDVVEEPERPGAEIMPGIFGVPNGNSV